jgi:hypothetical protein
MKSLPKTSCPDQDTFAKIFLNEVGAEKREAFIDHILECDLCRSQFDVLKQVGKEFRSQEGEFSALARESWKELESQKKATRPGWAWSLPTRLASSVLTILGLLVISYFFLVRPSQTNVLRTGERPRLRLVEPEGQIRKPPALFKWTPVLKADSYTFELIDGNLQTLIRQDGIKQNSYGVPSDVQKKMARGKPYIWTIEVYDDLGLKVDSGQQHFEIE